jgi:hypothetical protein
METCRVSLPSAERLINPSTVEAASAEFNLRATLLVSAHEAGILPSDLYLALKPPMDGESA